MLAGDRLNDTHEGMKLTVTGSLRVIRHPDAVVGGVKGPEWSEAQVMEG